MYAPPPPHPSTPGPKPDTSIHQFDGSSTGPGQGPAPLPSAPGMDSPPAISTDSAGSAATTVDTAAMRSFAKNMDQMMANVQKVRDLIDPSRLQVPAGAFAQAYQLRTNVLGSSTTAAGDGSTSGIMPVVPGTYHFLQNANDALAVLQKNMEAISALYEKTEDLNKEQSQQLSDLMQDTASSLSLATGAQLTGPSTTGLTAPPSGGTTTGGSTTGASTTGGNTAG